MNGPRPSEQLLRITDVQARTGQRASVWRLVRDASFPAPVRIGRRAVAWLGTEIDSWIADCVKARNTPSVWRSERPRITADPIYSS
jgi:prophage regulatory protein